jgi:DNA processing protein
VIERLPGASDSPSGAPTHERTARQVLLHLGEPGDRSLGRFVAEHGAIEAVQRIRAGHGPGRDGRHEARVRGIDLAGESALAQRCGARLICPGDQEWPASRLLPLQVQPHALWVRGSGALDALIGTAVAIVGSRASTAYGEHVATDLSAGLADRDWTVISGAAYGIDGAAHRASLAVGGRTIAVLAGGVDDAYPKGHASLLARIVETGLIVSELPVGESPTRARFLERNRLIAALGCGAVAVEMAHRSGARNTLEHAEKLLRPVMAVPGPVTSAMSAGCHEWITERRAELVTCVDDVLRVLLPVGSLDEPARRGLERATDRLGQDALAVYEALPPVDRLPLAELPAVSRLPGPVVGDALRELLQAQLVAVGDGVVARARPNRRSGP